MIFVGGYSLILMALAVIPALFLLFYIYKQDGLEKEPPRLILRLVVLGAISTFFAGFTESIGIKILGSVFSYNSLSYRVLLYFVVVGLSEEGFKYLVLRFSTWNSREFNCKFDGVVYAVAVSLGFALWENIQYVTSYGLSTALIRAVTAVPGHACFGVLMGAWYGLAKRKQIQQWGNASFLARLLAVIIPTIIHGAYDFVATSNMNTIHFVMFVVVMFVVCFYTVKKLSADDKYHNDEGNYGI